MHDYNLPICLPSSSWKTSLLWLKTFGGKDIPHLGAQFAEASVQLVSKVQRNTLVVTGITD